MESGATLVADYYTGGLASLGNGWQSKGSQKELNSPAGKVGQVGASLAGWGVGSSTTGIPASPLITGAESYFGTSGLSGGMDMSGGSGGGSMSMGDFGSGGMSGGSGLPSGSGISDQNWFDQQVMQNTAQASGDYGAGTGMGNPGGGMMGNGSAGGGGLGGMMKGILPYAGAANVVGGLYGLYASHGAAKNANQYGDQIAKLEADPSSIKNTPGYAAGEQTVRNTDASTGYGHSGKEQLDLFNYGNQAYTNQIQTLSGLQQNAQSGVPTATGSIGGIGMGLGMMAAGGSFDSLLSFL
jgi:hypothetical protein